MREQLLELILEEYGTSELLGAEHNPRVLEYFAESGNSWVLDDETAWCAAFVGFALEGVELASTRKLNARSYLDYGTEVKTPQVGDLVVLWRGSKTGWQGHVGFYINSDKNGIYILGGNQSNKVNISQYPKNRLLSYRRPQYKKSSQLNPDSLSNSVVVSQFVKRFLWK